MRKAPTVTVNAPLSSAAPVMLINQQDVTGLQRTTPALTLS